MIARLVVLLLGTAWVAWLYACGPEPCTPGAQKPCGNGVGQCQGAMQTCSPSGSWGLCDKSPSAELCDGEDNDCDGLTDEDRLEWAPGIDPVVPGPVEFVEAVGDYFLVGGVAPSLVDTQKERIWVALYDATGARLGELDLADPVNVGDKVRAAVAPSGDRAIVLRVVPQTAPVYAALLELDLDPQSQTFGTISDPVGLDEPAVTSLEVSTPDLAIPVFDDSVVSNQLVLFVMDNMGGSQGDLVALRYDVNTLCGSNDALCPPTGPVNVVQNVLRDDFVVMAPTDPTMDFVLGYFLSTTLYLTHVPRDTLLADPGGRTITSFPLIPELAAGPGGAALLAYRSQAKLTVSRFEADTFECTGNPSAFVESCPQELGDTGGERPSAAYWPEEQAWLVGDKETAQGWRVSAVDAEDGAPFAIGAEPTDAALALHLAMNDSSAALASQSNSGTQVSSLVRVMEHIKTCVCEPGIDTQPCGSDVGECVAGIQNCEGFGLWGQCEGDQGPTTEICNGLDDNCDGQTDEGFAVADYYADNDGDGFGAGNAVQACTAPAGYVTNDSDCYDQNANARPGQTGWFTTHRGDGSFDYDCDGSETERYPWEFVLCGFSHFDRDVWLSSAPACGEVGSWGYSFEVYGCTDEGLRTQTCR